ncbi:hypothetical protein AUQ48_09450 [Kocuria flava]|uniref:Aminoglycoside phosphotransferase domain-containing protein n=1 Tax=Kocuria flava TaxID=446860 RepID=A0A2N4T2H2_9MICC|nr:phosphotransferase [Kocuria flava]PLC12420.1 hypothetical protein AUQ48_09450 [Kocuria flava]
MSTSLEHLAAVAAAGVPGLAPVAVSPSPDDDADFRSAVVLDAEGRRWRVRAPVTPEAGVRLETEHLVLRSFTPAIRSRLPFLVPTAVAAVEDERLHAVVHSHIEGEPLGLDALARMAAHPDPAHHRHVPSAEPLPPLAVQLGRVLAAVHALPPSLVLDADLPSYTAGQCRERRLAELRRAEATGRVPAALVGRWERVLGDDAVWGFVPRVVHGDLQEDDLVISRGRVRGVTGWTDLHVGDPADDFAWLIGARDARFAAAVLEAYAGTCRDRTFRAPDADPDPHLLDRARLDAELAVARWLVRGTDRGDAATVADAERMLAALERDVSRAARGVAGTAPGGTAAPGAPHGAGGAAGAQDVTGSAAGRHHSAGDASGVSVSGLRPGTAGAAPGPGGTPGEACTPASGGAPGSGRRPASDGTPGPAGARTPGGSGAPGSSGAPGRTRAPGGSTLPRPSSPAAAAGVTASGDPRAGGADTEALDTGAVRGAAARARGSAAGEAPDAAPGRGGPGTGDPAQGRSTTR